LAGIGPVARRLAMTRRPLALSARLGRGVVAPRLAGERPVACGLAKGATRWPSAFARLRRGCGPPGLAGKRFAAGLALERARPAGFAGRCIRIAASRWSRG